MFTNLGRILSIGFGVAVWGVTSGSAQAQIGGLQIQIGRGPYGGNGLYVGGINVPFGVGPLIPPSSRAYMGPQYQSGYRGYYGNYGVSPALGVYDSPFNYPSPTYRNYGYSSQDPLDQLLWQRYQLQQNQLELQVLQRSLSAQQAYPYDVQSRYSGHSPRVSSSTSDLRPGMVLPDGSTVISVGPISTTNSASQQPGAQQPGAQQSSAQQSSAQQSSAQQPSAQQPSAQQPSAQQPTVQQPTVQPNVLPPDSPKTNKASF